MSNLNHVAPVFRVTDLQRSVAYYRDKLGFEVAFNHGGFYAGVTSGGCHVHLKHDASAQRDQAAFEAAEHLDACFEVQNAQELAVQFSKAGAAFSVPLRTQPYGKEFYIKDPDGYILGFVQPVAAANT